MRAQGTPGRNVTAYFSIYWAKIIRGLNMLFEICICFKGPQEPWHSFRRFLFRTAASEIEGGTFSEF